MPKITVPQDMSHIKTPEQFMRYSSILLSSIVDMINGNMLPQDNLRTAIVPVSFSASGVEVQFSHNLGKIPQYYIIINRSTDMTVYNGSTANTGDKIYLQASAAGNGSILIF